MSKAATEGTPLLPSKRPAVAGADEGTDVWQTTSNMINCFIGAGILTVPFAFSLAGYGAVLGLALVAALNWFASVVLGHALDKAAVIRLDLPASSWDMATLGEVAFGSSGQRLITILFGLELWFALETFIVLTGINVHLVTGIPTTTVIFGAGMLGVLSISLPPSVIARFSFLSVWCMFGGLLVLCVCGYANSKAAAALPSSVPTHHTMLDLGGMPSAIGIFLYCFSGLPCLPNIRATMHKTGDYGTAVHAAHFFAFCYYCAIGLVGYHFFAGNMKASFTEKLSPIPGQQHQMFYSGLAMMSAALFAIKLQTGFPLYAAPVLQAFGFAANGGRSGSSIWLARLVFATVSISFAIFAQDELDSVAELMGAFLTNTTSIIFPVLAYIALCHARHEKIGIGKAFGLFVLLVFGLFFGVVGTGSALRRFWQEEQQDWGIKQA